MYLCLRVHHCVSPKRTLKKLAGFMRLTMKTVLIEVKMTEHVSYSTIGSTNEAVCRNRLLCSASIINKVLDLGM